MSDRQQCTFTELHAAHFMIMQVKEIAAVLLS